MSSQVFYRKWRPQTLAEVVGQETVTRTLLGALEKERIAHAYLFCGPRGTGKTSTGRILAKAVNCLENGHGEPCNHCSMCSAVTEGHAMDIIEIDAASNTGIDDIRDLREKVNYHPGEARFKVYIIDEVHMLSNAASNALLKTLEEPPPRVIFVLATTETHKLLPTIISRCQRFDFRRLTQEDVVDKLAQICGEEDIDIPPEGLILIARRTRGSLRDAENLLQQVSTYYGNTAELSQIQEMLGITGDARVRELAGHIMTSDIAAGMAVINAVNQDGLDLKQFNRELIDYLRAVMLTVSGAGDTLDLADDERREVDALAKKATLPRLLHAVKLFGQLDFSFDQYSSLPLELALVDSILGVDGSRPATTAAPASTTTPPAPAPETAKPKAKPQPESVIPKADVPKTVVKKEAAPAKEDIAPATPPAAATTTPPPAKAEVKPAATPAATDISEPEPSAEPEEPKKEPEPPVSKPPSEASADSGDELERLSANWKRLIDTAPPEVRKSAAIGYIRSAGVRPIAIEDDTVVLTFRYDIHKKQVEKPENQRIVAGIVSGFLNRSCRIRCVCQPENNHLVRAVQNLGAEITSVEEK
jgi:DNA polymerase III subunit gamma/tau